MATLVLCWRPPESDGIVMLSVMCIPFNSIEFVTKMSEKRECISPSAIQIKNWHKTISTEENLEVISRLEKGEQTVGIYCNVRFAHSSAPTIHNNAGRITESDRSGPTSFVARPPQSYHNEPYQKLLM